MYEYRKIRRPITESQIRELEEGGWEYAGQVRRKGKDTDVMRFQRPSGSVILEEVMLFPREIVSWREATGAGVGALFSLMLLYSLLAQVESVAGVMCLALALMLTALFVNQTALKNIRDRKAESWMDECVRSAPIHPDDNEQWKWDARFTNHINT